MKQEPRYTWTTHAHIHFECHQRAKASVKQSEDIEDLKQKFEDLIAILRDIKQ